MSNIIFKLFDNKFNNKLRKRLKCNDFSLFTSNCMGGVIYNRLGLEFKSPTINYFMSDADFLKFVMNMDFYLKQELKEKGCDETGHPVGVLGDIEIKFAHYKTFKDGYDCWNRRKKRINFDRLYFIFFDTIDGELSENDIKKIGQIKCANKIILSKRKWPEYDYVLTIPVKKHDKNKHYMNRNLIGRRRFETKFDFVEWINLGV